MCTSILPVVFTQWELFGVGFLKLVFYGGARVFFVFMISKFQNKG